MVVLTRDVGFTKSPEIATCQDCVSARERALSALGQKRTLRGSAIRVRSTPTAVMPPVDPKRLLSARNGHSQQL